MCTDYFYKRTKTLFTFKTYESAIGLKELPNAYDFK